MNSSECPGLHTPRLTVSQTLRSAATSAVALQLEYGFRCGVWSRRSVDRSAAERGAHRGQDTCGQLKFRLFVSCSDMLGSTAGEARVEHRRILGGTSCRTFRSISRFPQQFNFMGVPCHPGQRRLLRSIRSSSVRIYSASLSAWWCMMQWRLGYVARTLFEQAGTTCTRCRKLNTRSDGCLPRDSGCLTFQVLFVSGFGTLFFANFVALWAIP